MNANPAARVEVTHRFPVAADRVFDAWLVPETSRRWLFATPAGAIVECRIDPQVGGRFTIVDRRDGEDVAHVGEYLEIDRPKRLVFSFGVPKYSSACARVSIDISPVPDGCVLALTTDGVPQEYADGTRKGWADLLGGLEAVLVAKTPGA
jgi:uncharacterized protein YndB with AHSA1/START domain